MSRAVVAKKQTMAWCSARATTWALLVGAAVALLAVNPYLVWVGYVPLHFS